MSSMSSINDSPNADYFVRGLIYWTPEQAFLQRDSVSYSHTRAIFVHTCKYSAVGLPLAVGALTGAFLDSVPGFLYLLTMPYYVILCLSLVTFRALYVPPVADQNQYTTSSCGYAEPFLYGTAKSDCTSSGSRTDLWDLSLLPLHSEWDSQWLYRAVWFPRLSGVLWALPATGERTYISSIW